MVFFVWVETLQHNDTAIIKCVSESGDTEHRKQIITQAHLAADLVSQMIADIEKADRHNKVDYIHWQAASESVKAHLNGLFDDSAPSPAQLSVSDLRVLHDENHLCPACACYSACTIGIATKKAVNMYPTVTACLGFSDLAEDWSSDPGA